MATGKHARPSDFDGRWILGVVLAVLILAQILMCSETVRENLSLVDKYEGQRIGFEKK